MTTPREIWECSNCDGLFWSDENCTCDRPNWNGPASQNRLTTAGYRILGPDEVADVRRIVEIANRNEWSAEGDRLVRALGRKA